MTIFFAQSHTLLKMAKPFPYVILSIGIFFSACKSEKDPFPGYKKAEVTHHLISSPIVLHIALSLEQQTQGLSGIREMDFPNNHGMLFAYPSWGPRSFWMPDTYFDLDIFYLDQNLRVAHIERNIPHHPGRSEVPPIFRVRTIYAQHVIELKSNDPISKKIKVNDHFIWSKSNPLSLEKILLNTRPSQ